MSDVAVPIEIWASPGLHLLMADDPSGPRTASRNDRELLRLVREGDSERFAELIDRYQRHVIRIVGRRVPPDRVEEVVHDVFVRAYVNLAQFSGLVSFDHWLAGIAVRSCYDFWRARARDDVPVSALSEDHRRWIEQTLSAQSDDQFRRQTEKQEAFEVLQWALGQLSPENRAVLSLVHLDGYSVRETAELLGWTAINVKVRAHRARQTLRKLLRQLSPGSSS
jgi:RNA polymerase sigma-70 factor, ECF subfamily